MRRAQGYVLYQGPSRLNGEPIVAIATMRTANVKTGNMVQTWILTAEVSPEQAVKTGADEAVCGSCPHRHFLNGGCYVVPAFSGLFAPHWRSDARGALVGLTRFVNRGHIARAALEATAFQTREVLDAMNADSGVPLTELRVDGGMVANEALMQFQADILGVDVVRPEVAETTALGAAYAAGIAVGFWEGEADVVANWAEDRRWSPRMPAEERERTYRLWRKAVTRTFDWVDEDVV